MKTIIISLALFIASAIGYQSQAQIKIQVKNNIELKVEELQQQKSKVEQAERNKLREEIEEINERLEDGEITADEAEELKTKAAEKRALNIQNQLNIIDENIQLLKRNGMIEEGEEEVRIDDYYTSMEFLKFSINSKKKDYDSIPSRTTSGLFVAFGLNNALIDGQSIDDSPYKIGGSRFFEIGYQFETMLTKSGFARLNYGFSFQFNGLKADDNLYFVEDEDQTVLEEFPFDLDKAKLRMDNLVIPVHFEFGPSKVEYRKRSAHYNTENFKVGLGGYAGLNLNTIQKLKYEEDGKNRKDKLSQSYNTSNFIYGLSGYIGYDDWALYVKYDLNTIFKDNPIEQNNISVGLRYGI